MAARLPGKLVIISGPSGAGKSTVVARLLRQCPLPLQLSVSATTREPRAGEQPGVDYDFLTHEQFDRLRREGAFLECKEVFGRGDWYGTRRETVTTGLAAGKWLILEIDVGGARAVLESYPDSITLFVHCGSSAELERRLRNRATEAEEALQRRLAVAREELESLHLYQHVILNDSPDRAVDEICGILMQYATAAEPH